VEITIWGIGAVGIGIATAVAREGETLRLLGRDARTLEAIEREGISRIGRFGDRRVPPEWLAVARDLSEIADAPPEWLLVCTKAHATGEVARVLAPHAEAFLDARTKLVLCQNGWGNDRPFRSFWPEEQLFHARVITGFQRSGLTSVEVTAHAAPIALGSISGGHEPTLEDLAARIDRGGLPAETCDDMRGVLWAKMLYNCALNPLGALTRRRYGALTEDPETRAVVEGVVRELFDVLEAADIPLAWPDAEAYLDAFHTTLIPPTAEHESSMLQDLRAGRPTEIEALCGAVEALAAEHAVATPLVSALATLVRLAESTADRAIGGDG
jgi:2-dehydropantoate 2-reductase